jgi:serine/threonine protein kinase
VALKAAHAPDAETEQRIEREAMALRSVRHPHCVRIFDLVSARSDPGLAELDGMVIVMEYVDGQSLGDLVRGPRRARRHRRRARVGVGGGRARRRARHRG